MQDLSIYFADHCRMFVHLAREAKSAVILRRGPTKWWQLILWDTRLDKFETGQWFHGSVYPSRCDVSPDGKLFLYCAGKYSFRDVSDTWTAVSRPPYFTALDLWAEPSGNWGGGGVFVGTNMVSLRSFEAGTGQPPSPLRFAEPLPDSAPSWGSGWEPVPEPARKKRAIAWRKTHRKLTLEREEPGSSLLVPTSKLTLYTLLKADESIALFEADWADFDQRGRLVATAGGRVLEAKLTRKNDLEWRELASFHEERPYRMEAPSWAQHW